MFSLRVKITLGFIIISSLFASFWYFRPNGHIQIFEKPIPYIFDKSFYRTLRLYVDEGDHESVLAVFGPKGIGKTRGLMEFAKELQKEGRLVIDFDFLKLSVFVDPHNVMGFIANSIAEAFKGLEGISYKTYNMKMALENLRMMSAFTSRDYPLDIKMASIIDDPILKNAAECLITIFESACNQTVIKATSIFDTFEILKDSLKPVFIIHEPYRFKSVIESDNKMDALVGQISSMFSDNRKGAFSTPIIFDLEDQSKIPLYKEHPFRLIRPYEFKEDEALKSFVDNEKIFSASQFHTLYKMFGGNGLYFALANELLSNGYPFSEAVNIITNDIRSSIVRQIKTSGNSKEMQGILLGYTQNKPKLADVKSPTTQQLLHSGLFSYVNSRLDYVEPSTIGVGTVMKQMKASKFSF